MKTIALGWKVQQSVVLGAEALKAKNIWHCFRLRRIAPLLNNMVE